MDFKKRAERIHANVRPLSVDLGDGDILNITYRRVEMTTGEMRRFNELVRDAKQLEGVDDLAAAELVLQTTDLKYKRFFDSVVSWDAVSDGVPIALTQEDLDANEIPVGVIDKILDAIQEDQAPKPKTGRK